MWNNFSEYENDHCYFIFKRFFQNLFFQQWYFNKYDFEHSTQSKKNRNERVYHDPIIYRNSMCDYQILAKKKTVTKKQIT